MFKKACIVKYKGVIAPYVMEAYNRAFRKMGLRTFILDLTNLIEEPQRLQQKINELIDWQPDVAVCYGHTGLLNAKEGYIFRVMGVPLVILHYDCPFFVLDDTSLAEFNNYPNFYYHFIWDKSFLEVYRRKQIANSHHIMLAVDPEAFYFKKAQYKYDISFIGGVGDFMAKKQQRLVQFSPQVNEFLDQVIMAKLENPSLPVLDIWQHLYSKEFPQFPPDWNNRSTKGLYHIVHTEGSMIMRRVYLDALNSARPDVFGTQWENPDISFHDKVEYFKELPKVYADSRINLNITSLQLEKSINNRIFDVGAVGGFLLTDYREDLQGVFREYEKITYHSIDELNEKVQYYLAHESERKELARELHKSVLDGHTYLNRVEYILETLQKRPVPSKKHSKYVENGKKYDYTGACNANLLKLIPSLCSKILDVGCADGVFGRVLLDNNLAKEVVGLEINPDTAAKAENRLSRVYCVDVENFEIPYSAGYFDCLVYGDSLEHLRDPEAVLKRHLTYLKDDGHIVCSIPNIRNLFIIHHLLHGNWSYTDWGILDRTHLRFYTLKEIKKMFGRVNLTIEHIEPSLRDGHWYTKMYGSEAVSRDFIERYDSLLQDLLKGHDISGKLKELYNFEDLSPGETAEFFAAQFHLRARKR